MYARLLSFVLLLVTVSAFAQTDTVKNNAPDNAIFVVAEKMPQYPGGDEALAEYINNTVKVPLENNGNKIFVKVIVEKNGTCTAELMLGIGNPRLEKQVVNTMTSINTWIPAEQNGKIVRAQRTIPIKLVRKKKQTGGGNRP